MERLLTVRELMDLLQISYPTLYRWRKDGTFPQPVNGSGRGKKLLWHPAGIERWSNYRQSLSSASEQAGMGGETFKRRQESALATLARHGIVRKPQG